MTYDLFWFVVAGAIMTAAMGMDNMSKALSPVARLLATFLSDVLTWVSWALWETWINVLQTSLTFVTSVVSWLDTSISSIWWRRRYILIPMRLLAKLLYHVRLASWSIFWKLFSSPFQFVWRKLKKRYGRRISKSRFGVAWKVYKKGLPKNNPPKTMTVTEFKDFVGAVAASNTDYWFDDNVVIVFNGGVTPEIAVNMKTLKIVNSDVTRPKRSAQVRGQYRRTTAEEPPTWLNSRESQ